MYDVLCCSYKPHLITYVLSLTYDIKDGLAGPQTIYLDADIKKYQVNSGKSHWSMSSTQYVKNAIKTV